MALPKVIYVHEEDDRDGSSYLVANLKPEQEGKIGVYTLTETIDVRHQTQIRRPKTKAWFPAR